MLKGKTLCDGVTREHGDSINQKELFSQLGTPLLAYSLQASGQKDSKCLDDQLIKAAVAPSFLSLKPTKVITSMG